MALLRGSRFAELIRFYQAAAVNTLFGYSLYALFVWLGINPFVAQLVAHISGTMFNYFTYSRHVFRATEPAKSRFVAAYIVNYLVNLSLLAVFALFVRSPYLAGGGAVLGASIINYVALKRLVFVPRAPTA